MYVRLLHAQKLFTSPESSWRLKQHGKTMQHHRAMLFGNVTEFPSLLLTSPVALCHFSPFTSIPCPPHEGTLVAEIVGSHIMLPSLVLMCPCCLMQLPSRHNCGNGLYTHLMRMMPPFLYLLYVNPKKKAENTPRPSLHWRRKHQVLLLYVIHKAVSSYDSSLAWMEPKWKQILSRQDSPSSSSTIEGKHTGSKENQWLCIWCIQRVSGREIALLTTKAATVPLTQQGTDRLQALFQILFSNWSRLCCQQENGILYKSRGTYLPLHFQRWDNSSMAVFNSCPVDIHSKSPCSLPRKDRQGGIQSAAKMGSGCCSQGHNCMFCKEVLGLSTFNMQLIFQVMPGNLSKDKQVTLLISGAKGSHPNSVWTFAQD